MLTFEQLESRTVPANIVQAGGLLTVYGDVAQPNQILADNVPGGISVTLNGQETVYSGVSHITLIGGEANDRIVNRSTTPSSIYGLEGNDLIRVFSGNDFMVPGAGNDDVQALVGTNRVYTNEDGEVDFVVASQTSFVSAASNDVVTRPTQFHLAGDTLYVIGSAVAVNYNADEILVIYGPNFVLTAKFDYLVHIGTNANDVFINVSDAEAIVFGGNGTDVYVGDLSKTQFADAIEYVFSN